MSPLYANDGRSGIVLYRLYLLCELGRKFAWSLFAFFMIFKTTVWISVGLYLQEISGASFIHTVS